MKNFMKLGILLGFVLGIALFSTMSSERPSEGISRPPALNTRCFEKPITLTSTSGELSIDKIGVKSAEIFQTQVSSNGEMPDPPTLNDIVLYDFSHWEGRYGGILGESGNAILAAHLDGLVCDNNEAIHKAGIFYNLINLVVGDEVGINLKGVELTYEVSSIYAVSAADDFASVVKRTEQEQITLVTCTGQFRNGEYVNRLIVVAKRIK